MNATYISLIFLWAVVFYSLYYEKKKRKKNAVAHRIRKKKGSSKENIMLEFIKDFIEKDCIIYTMEGKEIVGKLLAVSETGNAILVESGGANKQIINLEYVTRLREHPINPKNGKKKNVISD